MDCCAVTQEKLAGVWFHVQRRGWGMWHPVVTRRVQRSIVHCMTRHSPFDTSLAAAETIARRMPIIWWGMVSPTAASNAEMVKMVVEKQMAIAEACFAFHTEMFKAALTPWWNMSAGGQAKAADTMMQAVMAPSSRRVKANALRLRRR